MVHVMVISLPTSPSATQLNVGKLLSVNGATAGSVVNPGKSSSICYAKLR